MLIMEEAFFFGCSHCASDRDSITTTFWLQLCTLQTFLMLSCSSFDAACKRLKSRDAIEIRKEEEEKEEERCHRCTGRKSRKRRFCAKPAIRNVDRGTFTPLVFTTAGGAGPAANVFLKRLADKVAENKNAT